MEVLVTERLIVRQARETDLPDFLAYRNHPESLRLQPIKPMTEEAAATFLAKQSSLDLGSATGWIMLAVELRETGQMVGEVGLFLSPEPKSEGDLGWSIHPDFQRRGYATEAVPNLLAYAFEKRALHRVTANCDARNTASFRIMERLGMRREGHFRQSGFANGDWHDEYLYALLREEWLARPRS